MDARALRHVFGRDRTSPVIHSFSRFHFDRAFQPLPPPTGPYPFNLDLKSILGEEEVNKIATAGKLVFHTVGDTGNAKYGAEAQDSVARHMEEQLRVDDPAARPRFFYHLGDVVYFQGERSKYEGQFYDPYLNYTAPVFAIAGNHDGAPAAGEYSLQGFVENFCTSQPGHTWMAGHSNRTTMIQPNVYWTLRTPLCCMIGLYSNVPGRLDKDDSTQQDWLTAELSAARGRKEKCILVAVHHPPYSLDDTHGGHEPIREALDQAFADSRVTPTAVLTAHVHNYQRFERPMGRRKVPYVVAGAGGYAGYTALHQLKPGVSVQGVPLVSHKEDLPGFLRITVTRTRLTGEYFVVPPPPRHLVDPATRVDTFTVTL